MRGWTDSMGQHELVVRAQRGDHDAFNAIARAVERALFALEDLDERDWNDARAAYADFALERS